MYVDEKTAQWNQRLKSPDVKFPKGLFTFYLSHPEASRHYVRKWELEFEKKHPKIALINPFYDMPGEQEKRVKAVDAGKRYKGLPGDEAYFCSEDHEMGSSKITPKARMNMETKFTNLLIEITGLS